MTAAMLTAMMTTILVVIVLPLLATGHQRQGVQNSEAVAAMSPSIRDNAVRQKKVHVDSILLLRACGYAREEIASACGWLLDRNRGMPARSADSLAATLDLLREFHRHGPRREPVCR